ncbi:hypothetical protein, partial [Actinoplanes palleronii]|uniref:hypothetical protein n=1 Tax=Actinoplanes palleronii TaxID=113570 RepID=UPI00194337C4
QGCLASSDTPLRTSQEREARCGRLTRGHRVRLARLARLASPARRALAREKPHKRALMIFLGLTPGAGDISGSATFGGNNFACKEIEISLTYCARAEPGVNKDKAKSTPGR